MHPRLILTAAIACALGLPALADAAPAPAPTPGKAYMQYYVALRGAFRLEEVLPHLSRRARGELALALKDRKVRTLAPHARAAAKRTLLEQRRLVSFDALEPIEVLQETVRGARATLLAEGLLREAPEAQLTDSGLPARRLGQATVVLVREQGVWRLDREQIDAIAPLNTPIPKGTPEVMPGANGRDTMPATPAPPRPTPVQAASPASSPSATATGAPVLPSPQLPSGDGRATPSP